MRADWIRADKYSPKEAGSYLVTTHKGNVMIDRFDGEGWARCQPRIDIKGRDKGRYKMHKAWTFLPLPYNEGDVKEYL